jgi:hypothetical protein
MTRVEGGLAAARLPRGELDLEPRVSQQRLGVGDGLREDQVAEAGGKQLNPAGLRSDR